MGHNASALGPEIGFALDGASVMPTTLALRSA
jgi:hypothetical protein